MNTRRPIIRNRISTSAISIALIAFSGLWLVSASEYYATSGLRVDWSATPLSWMFAVVLTPAICFSGCMILVDQRKQKPQQMTPTELWALAAAFLPVTLGSLLSVWAVRVLFSMSGV